MLFGTAFFQPADLVNYGSKENCTFQKFRVRKALYCNIVANIVFYTLYKIQSLCLKNFIPLAKK